MKKLLFLIALVALSSSIVFSQGCLPEKALLLQPRNTIDNFQINYPGCTEIEGDVIISGNGISNLNGLSVLNSIGGNLMITDNSILSSFSGLENVTIIGGYLYIVFNSNMINFIGLNNLTFVEVI